MRKKLKSMIQDSVRFVKEDWASNPWRFVGETWNAISALLCAAIMAWAAPDVNKVLMVTYPLWLSGTIINVFCSRSRGSFGTFAMAVSMTIIDLWGFFNLLYK